ncbi:14762_t:CDS:2 [Entrophospora sp. SA101]|nr:14762_t:CDS:2 [Entrophospora sp. SA101]
MVLLSFWEINFPFSEKKQAERILFETLNIIVTESGKQTPKARFWENDRLQNEQVNTRNDQLLLTEKKKQHFIQVESNIVEQHFIASDKLLSVHKVYKYTEKSDQENVEKDVGEQDDNANDDEVVEEMQNSDYDKFTERYQKMDNDKKWKLTTGKIVEDSLYEFGMRHKYEHFRKYNTRDLRKAVFETQSWDMTFNQYEAKNLEKGHLELWYLIHIWCFESIDGVEALTHPNSRYGRFLLVAAEREILHEEEVPWRCE